MREVAMLIAAAVFGIVIGLCAGVIMYKTTPPPEPVTPNADMMALLPAPPPNWLEKMGDTETSRIVFAILEQRLRMAQLHAKTTDPNGGQDNAVQGRQKEGPQGQGR